MEVLKKENGGIEFARFVGPGSSCELYVNLMQIGLEIFLLEEFGDLRLFSKSEHDLIVKHLPNLSLDFLAKRILESFLKKYASENDPWTVVFSKFPAYVKDYTSDWAYNIGELQEIPKEQKAIKPVPLKSEDSSGRVNHPVQGSGPRMEGQVMQLEEDERKWMQVFMKSLEEWLTNASSMDDAEALESIEANEGIMKSHVEACVVGLNANSMGAACRSMVSMAPKIMPEMAPHVLDNFLQFCVHQTPINLLANLVCGNREMSYNLCRKSMMFDAAYNAYYLMRFFESRDIDLGDPNMIVVASLRFTRNLIWKQPALHAYLGVYIVEVLKVDLTKRINEPNVLVPGLGVLVNFCSSGIGRTAVLMDELDTLAMFVVERWISAQGSGRLASAEICRLSIALLWGSSTYHSRSDVSYLTAWMKAVIKVAEEFFNDERIIRTCLGAIRTRLSIHLVECKAIKSVPQIEDVSKRALGNFPHNKGLAQDVECIKHLLAAMNLLI